MQLTIDATTIENWKQRIHRYEVAYYDELRKVIAEYGSIPEAFPERIKGGKRISAYLTDEGILIIRWQNETDSFEFSYTQRSVKELMESSGLNVVLQTSVPPGMDHDIDDVQCGMKDGSVVSSNEWDRITITTNLSRERWDERQARTIARIKGLSLVTAHLMNLKSDGSQQSKALLEEFQKVTDDFANLLATNPREEDVQQFLTGHPELLSQSAQKVTPKVRLGAEFVTDFVIEEKDNEHILVEIEPPSCSLFTKRGDTSAEVRHAQRQVEDWRLWVQENIEYARKTLPDVLDPECWVVIGRRKPNDRSEQNRLRNINRNLIRIRIITYDDLLDRAKQFINKVRSIANK